MELLNIKGKSKYITIVSTIMLVALLSVATYAYFSFVLNNDASASYGVSINDENVNVSFLLAAAGDISLTVDPEAMDQSSTLQNGYYSYVQSADTSSTISFSKNGFAGNATCNYEIWYTPTNTFTNSSSNVSNYKELTILGSDSSHLNNNFEYDLNGIDEATKIYDGVIIANEISQITQRWTFIMRHYNIDADQSSHINSTFGGAITFKSRGCTDSKIVPSSSDVLLLNGDSTNITITNNNAGTITCTSSDSTLVTASLSGSTLTLNRLNVGNAIITCNSGKNGVSPAKIFVHGDVSISVNKHSTLSSAGKTATPIMACTNGSIIFNPRTYGYTIDLTNRSNTNDYSNCRTAQSKDNNPAVLFSDYIMNRSVGTCSNISYTTASSCVRTGGTWTTTAASGSCSIPSYTTKAQCDAATAGACYNLSNITLQSSYTTESTCRAAGYSWKKATWNGVFNENGFRYEGKDPNNYVWFNNEMWRIIGVFDNYYNDNTTHDYLVKLIKAEPIGALVWHYTTGVRWKDSSLYNLLNNYYYNLSDYPLDLTSTTSACSSYNGTNYADCRYSKSGIINSEYRNMIANARWNNQLVTDVSNLGTVYTNESVNDATYTVNAKVGLMYLSDYGYGVIGDNNGGSCARTTLMSSYNSSTCAGQNWIYGKGYEWTMTQYATSNAWRVNHGGSVSSKHYLNYGFALRPSVFLSSMVYYIDGDGSYENPYIIGA